MVKMCLKAEITATVHRPDMFYLILSTHFLSSPPETVGGEKTKNVNLFVTNIITFNPTYTVEN